MRAFVAAAALLTIVLAAIALWPRPSPPAHPARAPLSGTTVLTLVLGAGSSRDFSFENVHVRTVRGTDRVDRRTPLTDTAAMRILKSRPRLMFFLPGYNTSFTVGASDVARITAVVSRNTQVVYGDWGSKGRLLAYRRDGQSAARNAAAFGHALEYVYQNIPGAELDIFAHSMGSRVAIRGVAVTVDEGKRVPIRHLVLAAPDVQIRDYVSTMRQVADIGHSTIYVSHRDKALLLSAVIHFHHRLGQVSVERLNLPRTDVVDVSAEDRTTTGHGYALHDTAILGDICSIVDDDPLPHPRWCRSKRYLGVWLFIPIAARQLAC